MRKTNIKIITMTVSAAVLLSTTSCSLQKKNNFVSTKDSISFDIDNEKYNNISDENVKGIIVDLINRIENSNFDLPIDEFVNKLSNTTFIKNKDGDFTLGSYNDEDHMFTYLPGDEKTIRHELLHMVLKSHNNSSIDEGLVQILLHELYGYEIDEHVFDASLCKIFCRILSPEELKKFISGDDEVLKNKLAKIKPAYEDAEQFLIYANNAEYYYRLYNESFFNGTEQEFENSEEYEWLKQYRKAVKERIKIYLYNYYNTTSFDQNPYDRLVEIFEVLNLVNYFMYDSDLGEVNEQDYFLQPIVTMIRDTYNISDEVLIKADEEAKNCLSFKYLDKLKISEDEKVIN